MSEEQIKIGEIIHVNIHTMTDKLQTLNDAIMHLHSNKYLFILGDRPFSGSDIPAILQLRGQANVEEMLRKVTILCDDILHLVYLQEN